VAKRSGLGGLLCFAAGCLLVVFAIFHPGTSVVQTGLGGVLIALGLFWMGTKVRRRSDTPKHHGKDAREKDVRN
jgi:hypothetical protein